MDILDRSGFSWDPVGTVPSENLINTRDQLHHAVQLIAAAGKYLIPERADDSHTSLHWNKAENAFEGETIGKGQTLGIGIRPADMVLYIRDLSTHNKDEFALNDSTMDLAFLWMKDILEKKGIRTTELQLKMHYEIPPHSVGDGDMFKFNSSEQSAEITRYYSNAYQVLEATKNIIPHSSQIRCWPHHFDMAILIQVDKDKSTEDARSIGIGFSPGDDGYPEPYYYITPWPYPDLQKVKLPHLDSGVWHVEGWIGGVLTASEISSGPDQTDRVIQFINSTVSACAQLLNFKLKDFLLRPSESNKL